MSNVNIEPQDCDRAAVTQQAEPPEKVPWQTPKMEDVSEQVMAQPYIRFT